MAYDKHKIQDIKISEKNLFKELLSLYNSNDYDGINEFIVNHPEFKYKIINSYNWNRLCTLINDNGFNGNLSATTESLAGLWIDDYNNLSGTSKNFIYSGEWEEGINYYKNNLVRFDDESSYFCIQDHLSSQNNTPPNSGFWLPAECIVGVKGLPISETEPQNIITGDVYLEDGGIIYSLVLDSSTENATVELADDGIQTVTLHLGYFFDAFTGKITLGQEVPVSDLNVGDEYFWTNSDSYISKYTIKTLPSGSALSMNCKLDFYTVK